MMNLCRVLNSGRQLMVRATCRSSNWTTRSHKCGELRLKHSGARVTLSGWIQFLRLQKFIVLRDSYGTVQLVLNDDLWNGLKDVGVESVLEVSGQVVPRPKGQANSKMETGEIEVQVDKIANVNPSKKSLPFYIKDFNEGKEPLRMQYRYLDLRRQTLQNNLRLRSNVVSKIRNFLIDNEFVDVETPTLFRRTPGGAREFVVPTRIAGKFYSLVQSPQQFKQLLMVGGLDKYFQIARCYRDEGARPDRQPEFTQVDIELSFTHREGIEDLVEQLLKASWPQTLPQLSTPFVKMTYKDCMEMYGSDKPDLRIESQICDVTQIMTSDQTSDLGQKVFGLNSSLRVKCVKFENASLKEHPNAHYLNKELGDVLKKLKDSDDQTLIVAPLLTDPEGNVKSSFLKKFSPETQNALAKAIDLQKGDIGVLVVAENDLALKSLGKVRTEIGANFLNLNPTDFRFLWIEDFPLFLPSEKGEDRPGNLESAHHPFTQPHPDDLHLVYSDPLKVRGLHYDLVLNGFEIGGGSIRIHDCHLQEYVLKNVLGEDTTTLTHLLEALACGCPPHGGVALGLDRLIAILCQANSIRDVIAFPKTGDGKDLMADAPAAIRDEDKVFYHLK